MLIILRDDSGHISTYHNMEDYVEATKLYDEQEIEIQACRINEHDKLIWLRKEIV